ncbi:MAG: hypothetical protein KKD31_10040 [Bacteroidetes bacterium]|nr:hypothetical protein [Bacteroidota bacterium]
MKTMNRFARNILLIFCLMFVSCPVLLAQSDNRDTVVIVKEYSPTISDAIKISNNPEIKDSLQEKSKLNYRIESRVFKTEFGVSGINPAKMTQEPLTKLYRNLLKAGYGTYSTPYAEYYYNSLRSKNNMLVFHARHLSSSATLKDYGFSGYSNNAAEIDLRRFLRKQTLGFNAFVDRNVVHCYGYNPEDSLYANLDKDNTRQRFFLAGSSLSFGSSTMTGKDADYEIKTDFWTYSDLFDAVDSDISVGGFYAVPIKADTAMKSQYFKISFGGNYHRQQTAIDTLERGLINVLPEFTFRANFFSLRAGLKTYIESSPDSARFRLFPIAELGFSVSEDILQFYAGVNGGVNRNTFRSLTEENPFLNSVAYIRDSYQKYHAYAGFRGSFSSSVSFNLRFSDKKIESHPLFVNDSIPDLLFDVVYDNINIMDFHGEITYRKTEKIRLMAYTDYYIYKLDVQSKAWHMPSSKFGLMTKYNLKNTLIGTLDIFFVGDRFARQYEQSTATFSERKLKGYIDLNIGLEYRYSKMLGAFIRFQNLAATRYEEWNGYPSQRFSVLGGITYSF